MTDVGTFVVGTRLLAGPVIVVACTHPKPMQLAYLGATLKRTLGAVERAAVAKKLLAEATFRWGSFEKIIQSGAEAEELRLVGSKEAAEDAEFDWIDDPLCFLTQVPPQLLTPEHAALIAAAKIVGQARLDSWWEQFFYCNEICDVWDLQGNRGRPTRAHAQALYEHGPGAWHRTHQAKASAIRWAQANKLPLPAWTKEL